MMSGLINANPTIYEKKERRVRTTPSFSDQDDAVEPIDQLEVFDILFSNLSSSFPSINPIFRHKLSYY
ncbi:hypothetical protein Lalb_Chr09g0325401 [Lupinus albus]|uniref:Uncharacterized protein n=1 Tax=Lupinus albus TaxID=3870 RepID=A0A6A4Q0F7_LUPAL|nr:hypothetical protein Lalb_Chr09g0325401 [Lupinus albus]